MSKIKNAGLDQYGAEPFEQQQFGTAGVEVVNYLQIKWMNKWMNMQEWENYELNGTELRLEKLHHCHNGD